MQDCAFRYDIQFSNNFESYKYPSGVLALGSSITTQNFARYLICLTDKKFSACVHTNNTEIHICLHHWHKTGSKTNQTIFIFKYLLSPPVFTCVIT